MDPEVAAALRRVQAAMTEAESSMQRLHTLPSARLPSGWDRAARALRPAAQFAALAAACAAIHSLGAAARALGSLAVGLGVAWYGLRRSSLSPSGAAAVSPRAVGGVCVCEGGVGVGGGVRPQRAGTTGGQAGHQPGNSPRHPAACIAQQRRFAAQPASLPGRSAVADSGVLPVLAASLIQP